MLHKYVIKYSVLCYFVLYLVISAVADISLDYYFGNNGRLRSAIAVEDCKSGELVNYCYQKCGANHICLLGQCFCTGVNAPRKEKRYKYSRVLLRRTTTSMGVDSLVSDEKSFEDTTSESTEEDGDTMEESSEMLNDEELLTRPTLRHHIAHFCPNLDEARKCIRKCMKRRVPAFCGKDHHCYCGHRYGNSQGEGPKMTEEELRNQFADLYKKYFGPNIETMSHEEYE